jgi:arylsulfatase A-like enzyme
MFKYCYGPKSKMAALYDLQNDPQEDHNLADDPAHAETVRQMHRRLLEVMKEDGDPLAEQWAATPSP